MLAEPSLDAAAAAVGLNPRTLRRWYAEPGFQSALRSAGREVLGTTTHGLQAATAPALATLVNGLKSKKASDRIRSAVAILTLADKATVTADLMARVEKLEADHAPRVKRPGSPVGANGHG